MTDTNWIILFCCVRDCQGGVSAKESFDKKVHPGF